MQRKRRKTNYKEFPDSSGNRHDLHSIPALGMSKKGDKKSFSACIDFALFWKKIVNSANVTWWRSPHCRSSERRNRTRASHIIMTPLSRLARYPRSLIHNTGISRYLRPLPYVSIISLLVLSFLALMPNLYSNDSAYAAEDVGSNSNAIARSAGESSRATSAGLSVSSTKLTETVSPGSTVYVNNTVSVNAKDIESYSLTISGPTTMKNGSTTISGSGGNTPSSMGDNTWGYAWDSSNNGSGFTDSSVAYNSLPGTNTSTKLTTPALNNYGVEFSRKLGFAAKFAEDADPGHYIADITLSLVATPRTLGVWSTGQAAGISTMQQMNTAICNQVPTPAAGATDVPTMTLLDSRDGNYYNVAKYSDGRCWMQENLRLRLTTAGLKQSDTDLNQGYDWDQTTRAGVAKPTDTLTSISNGDGTFAGTQYKVESYIASSSNAGETGYYSWSAATAGTGGTDSSNAIAANSQAPSSICPKGWTLPTGGSTSNVNTESTWSDYYKLFRNMGLTISNTNLKPGANQSTSWGSGDLDIVQNKLDSNSKAIYNFKYTGLVYDGSLANTSGGFWWSSTAYDADYAYTLRINSSNVYPGAGSNVRYNGFAVRCVAKEPDLSGITTMQEMTSRVCEKTPLISGQKYSAEYTLKDTRDGKSYTVRKLGDGKCWMTSNLKLKLTTDGLKQSDTDLNQGYDWDQTTRAGVVKPTNTLTSLTTTSGNRDFSSDKGYYAVQSYIASSSNAGETGYYSWNAATAGTGGTSSSDAIAANNQAPSSICPKGWALPTSGNDATDEFSRFISANSISGDSAGSALIQSSIYNFKYTGFVNNGGFGYGSDNGFWWSSTAKDARNAYELDIGPSYVHIYNTNSRCQGFAVRCINRE